MRIGILHPSLNGVSGPEFLSLTFASTLKRANHEITYYTAEPTKWDVVENITNIRFRPDRERIYLSPKFKIPAFGLYTRLLERFFMEISCFVKEECDLVIGTHGFSTPLFCTDVIYVHSPSLLLWYKSPENIKYLASLLWRVYSTPYRLITENLLLRAISRRYLLTNSKFCQKILHEHIKANVTVIHPPISLPEYLPLSYFPKENLVVTIGRFWAAKHLEDVIEVASRVRNAEFCIIGHKVDDSYVRKLKELAEGKNLDNIKFVFNSSHQAKLKLLSRAKVYFHPTHEEHFGIAIIEGMAAGCVPVVHKSGGPWTDILDETQGLYGFAYCNLDEAASYITKLLRDEELRNTIVKRNRAYVARFSMESFKRKVLRLIDQLASKFDITR